MNKKVATRFLFLIAVLLPASLYFFPIWKITLIAPQYPDGVNMYIHIDKISGDTPATLQNINILNHYIGMKQIVPDEIPEFKYFPYVVAGIIGLGIVALIIGKSWAFFGWSVLFLILACLGVYDFYLWEYDYGHNLHPNAAIQVPGMVYQPPLIGKKYLLNFLAISLPATGGIMMGVSIILGFLSGWLKKKVQ